MGEGGSQVASTAGNYNLACLELSHHLKELCYFSTLLSCIAPQAANAALHSSGTDKWSFWVFCLLWCQWQPVFIWTRAANKSDSPSAVAELLSQPAGFHMLVSVESPSSFWTTFPGEKGHSAQYLDKLYPLSQLCSGSCQPWGSCPNSALTTESWMVSGVRWRGQLRGLAGLLCPTWQKAREQGILLSIPGFIPTAGMCRCCLLTSPAVLHAISFLIAF